MSFLAYLFHKENFSNGVITLARSTLSAILPLKEEKTFGECQKLSKMLKGIFKLSPTFPKKAVMYDDFCLSGDLARQRDQSVK